MHADPASPFPPRMPALAAFLCFAPVLASFAMAPGATWPEYPGIFYHLAMFLLVASLKAPEGARMAGYGWVLLDVAVGVLRIHHVPHEIADPLRFAAHIFAGIWVAMASMAGTRSVKVVGVIAGVWLASYTLVSPFLPTTFLAPCSVAMMTWLALIALQNGTGRTTIVESDDATSAVAR
jgi:hypothetical protein